MIEIHLDGKPVTKLQAARAAANLAGSFDYPVLPVGESDEGGWISSAVVVRGRQPERDGSGMRPATVSFPSIGSVPAAQARAFAEAVAVGAEVAELAEMLAADQAAPAPAPRCTWCHEPAADGEFCAPCAAAKAKIDAEQDAKQERTAQALAVARELDARGAAQRARAGAAKSGFKPVAKAETAPSLVGRIVVDHADDSPCPLTGKVVGQIDADTVEVLWGERQFEENPGQGTYEPIDALRPAREQAGA